MPCPRPWELFLWNMNVEEIALRFSSLNGSMSTFYRHFDCWLQNDLFSWRAAMRAAAPDKTNYLIHVTILNQPGERKMHFATRRVTFSSLKRSSRLFCRHIRGWRGSSVGKSLTKQTGGAEFHPQNSHKKSQPWWPLIVIPMLGVQRRWSITGVCQSVKQTDRLLGQIR